MRIMKVLVIVLIIAVLFNSVQNSKILGIFPTPVTSHYILGSALMNALAEKGHDVTMIALTEQKNSSNQGTFREIALSEIFKKIRGHTKQTNMHQFGSEYLNHFYIMDGMATLSDIVLSDSNVKKFIHSNETFDVVIVEQNSNEAQFGLAHHFNAPLIVFTTMGATNLVNLFTGNPSPLSYIPEYFLTYSSNMTLFERLINTLESFLIQLFKFFILLPKQEKILKKHFPNSPDFYDIIYNTSLVLLNSHPSFGQPVPLVPNMIEIGGFHVKLPKKLPNDLQQFLDSAESGVIYFSMDPYLKSTHLPVERRDAFLKTFSKLKQKVLWNWDADELQGKPANVKTAKGLPQQDILAHPNIKLFISHAGLLSNIETIYHGVPILEMPIVSDQKTNAARAVSSGYALQLELSDLTEEKLTRTINELLNNPKYRETAQLRSKIFHDQQVKPLDKAIYWVEYIIRHKGADHLRVAGVRFPWYKYFLLDVIGFGIFIIIAINILLFFVLSKVLCFGKRQKLKTN